LVLEHLVQQALVTKEAIQYFQQLHQQAAVQAGLPQVQQARAVQVVAVGVHLLPHQTMAVQEMKAVIRQLKVMLVVMVKMQTHVAAVAVAVHLKLEIQMDKAKAEMVLHQVLQVQL
jgi:hypothetical protein